MGEKEQAVLQSATRCRSAINQSIRATCRAVNSGMHMLRLQAHQVVCNRNRSNGSQQSTCSGAAGAHRRRREGQQAGSCARQLARTEHRQVATVKSKCWRSPAQEKKGVPASPATALASRVWPVPAGRAKVTTCR